MRGFSFLESEWASAKSSTTIGYVGGMQSAVPRSLKDLEVGALGVVLLKI
jgi:hypothetical protein